MKWDNFTGSKIAEFTCPTGKKQHIYWDGKQPGLGLRVTAGGSKSYIFEASLKAPKGIKGRTVRITIGDTKTYTLAQAQAQAATYKTDTNKGIDPRQVTADALAAEQFARAAKVQQLAIEKAKSELIARSAWNAYLAHPRPATGKKSWGSLHSADHDIAANPGGMTCKIGGKTAKPAPLAALLCMPLHAITHQVVRDWLAIECQTRPTFAHNCLRKFRAFIKWCSEHSEYQHVVHADCCINDAVRDITPISQTKAGDCLQREQLLDWFAAVRQIDNSVISAYLQALLVTGARRGEMAVLRWEDVEFNPRWASMTIRDKVDGVRTIPLPPYLGQLLNALPRRDGGWVFSSPSADSGHITEPRIAHTKALLVAGLPHVSLHGLRRSFTTLSEWVEAPTGVVAQIQGHKPSAIAEKHYRRRPLDLLRMWHVKIETWMLVQADISFVPLEAGLRVVAVA
jgi:integrase